MDRDEIDQEIVDARRAQAAAITWVDVTTLSPAEARALANTAAMLFNDGKPEVQRVEDFQIPGPGGSIRARLYQPQGARPDATIYYIHGGAWFVYDVDTHDRVLRFLAEASGLSVFALDYRLSPEHLYPAALDDTRAVWDWLLAHGASYGIPTAKIAIAGDSAGANLGLTLTIEQRDNGGRLPVGLALVYGCFAPGVKTESRERYSKRWYGLTGERVDWYWNNYLGAAAAAPPLQATPLHAELAGLPPVYLGIPECDVLADESRLLAARLAEANVPVEQDVWPNATHGLLQMTRDVQIARDATTAVAKALTRFFA